MNKITLGVVTIVLSLVALYALCFITSYSEITDIKIWEGYVWFSFPTSVVLMMCILGSVLGIIHGIVTIIMELTYEND